MQLDYKKIKKQPVNHYPLIEIASAVVLFLATIYCLTFLMLIII